MRTLKTIAVAALLLLTVAAAHARDNMDILSIKQSQMWEEGIKAYIERDMPALEATCPVTLEEAQELFNEITYIDDLPEAPECPGPANTLKRKGGDCEDMTMYVLARMEQLDEYASDQVGFIMMINTKSDAIVYAHIAPVFINPDEPDNPFIIDLADFMFKINGVLMRTLDQYRLTYQAAGYSLYRVWWFDTDLSKQTAIQAM